MSRNKNDCLVDWGEVVDRDEAIPGGEGHVRLLRHSDDEQLLC